MKREKKNSNSNFENLSDAELARGIELLVSPEELRSRPVMLAILKAADFTPEEVADQIAEGVPVFAGPAVSWTF